MRVRYINSQNYSVDFVDANILPTSGYLHQRKWNTTIENDSVSLSIGNYTYTITLTLRGSLKERKETLDKMCDIFELDCINETPGTLYFGDYYIKCYIVSSNTSIANINTRTNVELGIFCIKQEFGKRNFVEFFLKMLIFLPTKLRLEEREIKKDLFPFLQS